jgi:hypothetical protein
MSDIPAALDAILEKREVLLGLKEAVNVRLAYCTEEERSRVEDLSNRALRPQCTFDREHRLMLYALALAPDQVGWSFKLQEGLHRLLHKHWFERSLC